MFEVFRKEYHVTYELSLLNENIESLPARQTEELSVLLAEFGGKTFNDGVYRIYPVEQINEATKRIGAIFSDFNDRILCFAYDWLGRHFALDFGRICDGKPLILMLEPGVGETAEIPVNIVDFHNEELVNYPNDALAINFFKKWRKKNKKKEITPKHCVGYKIPLFLGGKDDVKNLELIDLDVYLEICGQLLRKTMHLPNGATIKDISISG